MSGRAGFRCAGANAAAGGYTLIEVIVAVTVFAFLAAGAYVALDGLSRAALDHRERSSEFGQLQTALARLDADLRQLATRPVRGPDGRLEPALTGARGQVAGTRAGWPNPAAQRRGVLQRFSWEVSRGELQRVSWPVTDRALASQPLAETLLDDLRLLEFRYRDGEGRWRDEWPDGGEELARLPSAIEVTLETERFGRLRRLVVLQ
jgi:general secretion pathway protein J